MSSLLNDALRSSLQMDYLGALDYAESVHRGCQRIKSPERLGLTAEEFGIVKAAAKAAYNALCAGRAVLDGRD